MRILKQGRTPLAASALRALLPVLALAEDTPAPAKENEPAYVLKIYDIRALETNSRRQHLRCADGKTGGPQAF